MPLNASIAIVPVPLETYHQIELASAIILCILSPVTVFSNLLLLTAIYKDPLKCFRTPITLFIVGLALADFITGLTVEPLFALYYFSKYLESSNKPEKAYSIMYSIGGKISTIAISTSFLVVLALSFSQYIAITHPHRYKELVSRGRVVVCLAFSVTYFTIFSLLQLTGINEKVYLTIDLVLHATLISVVLITAHCLLYSSFQRHLVRSKTLRGKTTDLTSAEERRRYRRKRSERQFTILTFYLAGILLASASFHTVVLYVFLFYEPKNQTENINIHIGLRISDLMLFMKVAVDCFIYAWRLPNYRKALKITLMKIRASSDRPMSGIEPGSNERENLSCRRYNHRTDFSVVNAQSKNAKPPPEPEGQLDSLQAN